MPVNRPIEGRSRDAAYPNYGLWLLIRGERARGVTAPLIDYSRGQARCNARARDTLKTVTDLADSRKNRGGNARTREHLTIVERLESARGIFASYPSSSTRDRVFLCRGARVDGFDSISCSPKRSAARWKLVFDPLRDAVRLIVRPWTNTAEK